MKLFKRLVCFFAGHVARWSPDDADDFCRRCGASVYPDAAWAKRKALVEKGSPKPQAAEAMAPVRGTLTTDRSDPGLRSLRPNGQQEKYLVLSEEERARGFVRPVRTSYKHLACCSVTTMGLALSETYARNPKFYSGTFCVFCGGHFDLVIVDGGLKRAFVWIERDGSEGPGVGE